MARMEWTVYYCGHGAMNYIEVMDESDSVVLKIVIDAGCTEDKCQTKDSEKREADVNFDELNTRLWNRWEDVSIIICITHYHEDHYNYLSHMYKSIVNREQMISIVFGSLSQESFWWDLNGFASMVHALLGEKNRSAIPDSAIKWHIHSEGNIELYMLWNCLCKGKNENDNSAAYLVRDTVRKVAFVFLGDMTGNTFLKVLETKEIISGMWELLDGYEKIVTVPHHGSIDTLFAGNFFNKTDYKCENIKPLVDAMGKLCLDCGRYFISNGIQDKHGHPDYTTAQSFLKLGANQKSYLMESLTAYLTYEYPGLGSDHWEVIRTNGYGLYVTGRSTDLEKNLWEALSYRVCVPSERGDRYSVEIWSEIPARPQLEDDRVGNVLPVRAPSQIVENRVNGDGTSFRELFGTLGKMCFYEGHSLRWEDVLGSVRLLECIRDGDAFQGTLDVLDSRLAVYSDILQGVVMRGKRQDGDLYGEGAIKCAVPSFAPLPLQIKEQAVVFWSGTEASGDREVLWSKAMIVFRGELGLTDPVSVSVQYPLLQGTQLWEQFSIVFEDGTGLSVADIGGFLPKLLGLEVDLPSLLPLELPFLTSVRLYEINVYRKGDFLRRKEAQGELDQVMVVFGYEENAWNHANGILSLDRLRFSLGLHLKKNALSRCSATLSADFKLLGQGFMVSASYPTYRITFYNSTKNGIALAKVAEAYGATLPASLADAAVSAIRFDGLLDFSEFYLQLEIASILQLKVSALGKVVVQQISFAVAHNTGGNCIGMELLTGLVVDEKTVASFMCSAEFAGGEWMLTGQLMADEDAFPAIYRAISGSELPAGFPSVKLLSGELCARYGTAFWIQSYGMELEVTVSDMKVFGIGFQMNASVQGSGSDLVLKGSFVLGDFFTVYAALSVKDACTEWKFGMLFAGILLEVSYDTVPEICISGRIAADLSLQDAVNDLVRRLDPQRSYVPSADWKLLDAVNLRNTQISYYYNRKEWELSVCPNLKLPFATVEKLCVVMGSKGIEFRMTGQFLNETYTEEKPLKWDEGDPPKPTGELLHINYLLLAQGIRTDLPDDVSVESAVKALEEQIPPDEAPKTLRCNPSAGMLGGMDFLVADAVQIQLVYDDYKPFYGAGFYLYGDKAGVLKGLKAEIAYTRLSETEGVFAGSVVPPKALRSIRLGALTLGVGRISATVHTNGDFALDLGYPKDRDYTHSFRLIYGMFEGLGGIYVKKGITEGLMLPQTDRGYFSPVLAMGIGMRLQLAKEVKAGPLSANASLVMQGVFEGIYATYLPNDGGGADTFYRVSAQVSFDGKLQGNVDFGIIGVAVMVSIHARSSLKLEAYCPVQAEIDLHVEAAASVKVLFCRINFHFSLRFGMQFVLDGGGNAPWAAMTDSCEESRMQSDAMPKMLRLGLAKKQAERTTITLHVAVNYGVADRQYVSAIFGLVSRRDFEKIVSAIGETAAINGYLKCTDGEELFKKERFFGDTQWLYRFLETYFVLKLDFVSAELGEDSVIMPLPDQLEFTLTEYLKNGDVRLRRRRLWELFPINADYRKKLDEYYADTMYVQPEEQGVRSVRSEETVSLAGQIFADYFELILKVIRAEQENARRNEKVFRHDRLEAEQLDNIIGLVSRFLLGGKRGVVTAVHCARSFGQTGHMVGLWALAGTQIDMPDWESVSDYCYELRLMPEHPDWVTLAENVEKISLTVPVQQMRMQFPAITFSPEIFVKEPEWMKCCEQVDANQVCAERILQVKGEKFSYYETGRNLMEHVVYHKAEETQSETLTFGILIPVTLQKCRRATSLFRMLGGSNFSLLREALERSAFIDDIRILYLSEAQDTQFTWYREGDCIQLANRIASGESVMTYSSLAERERFARMLADAGMEDGQNYFSFPKLCPLRNVEQQEIYFAFHICADQGYQNYFNCIVDRSDASRLTLQGDRKAMRIMLPQGAAGVVVTVNADSLTEQEKLLAMQYQNMALEIEDTVTHAVSHETLPFIGEGSDKKDTVYRMAVSYARALEGKDAEVYHFVTEQRPLIFRLLWIDIFGNRMVSGKELRIVPKYTDRIIAVHNYPNISVCYGVGEENGSRKLYICFDYDGNAPEDTGLWQQARCQLLQKDVSLRLYSGLLAETILLDKDRLVDFLQQCLQDPGQSAQLVYTADIREPENGTEWMDMRTWLYIFRKNIYVDPDAPKEASMVRSELVYRSDGAPPENSCPFLGDTDAWLLAADKQPIITLEQGWFYAWQRLPVVTGDFTDGKTQLRLTAFDLQEVFSLFEEDLSYLTSPNALEQLVRNQTLVPMVDRVYQLRTRAAKAMAGRIRPLFEGKGYTSDVLTTVQEYVEQLLKKEVDKEIQKVLFICFWGTSAFLNETPGRYFEGHISGCTDYPLKLAADAKQIAAVGGVPAQEIVHTQELAVELDSVRDEKQEQSYSPEKDAASRFRLPFPGVSDVRLPSFSLPQTPVYLRREELENGCALIFAVCPLAEDVVYLRARSGQMDSVPEQNEAVCAMYAYAGVSRSIADKTTPEGIQTLIPAMESYVKALGDLQDRIHREMPEYRFGFVRKESGESWHCIESGQAVDIVVECRYGTLDWYQMKQSGSRYCFDNEKPPAYGDVICLKLVLGGQQRKQQAYALSLVREQAQEETENIKRNRSFDRWSPEIWF